MLPDGFHYVSAYLDEPGQVRLAAEIRALLDEAPLFPHAPRVNGAAPGGQMTGAGEYGWVTDSEHGYRFVTTHPVTGRPWPAIPQSLIDMWTDTTGALTIPNVCLIDYYAAGAQLGLDDDRGTSSPDSPVMSISLGDEAVLAVGGPALDNDAEKTILRSGDLLWFSGPGKLFIRGTENVVAHSSTFLKDAGLGEGGRMTLTLRRVQPVT